MHTTRRVLGTLAVLAALLAPGLVTGPAAADVPAAKPLGGGPVQTVPRPPWDSGGDRTPIKRSVFATPDENVACRRLYGQDHWVECLLRRSSEIVRFGAPPTPPYLKVPCKPPHADQMCFGDVPQVTITKASSADKARFAKAKPIPLEVLVELGSRTRPWPECIADPNLGLACGTHEDDSVGAQIFIGIQDSIWICGGYEYVFDDTPVPSNADRCIVVRP